MTSYYKANTLTLKSVPDGIQTRHKQRVEANTRSLFNLHNYTRKR